MKRIILILLCCVLSLICTDIKNNNAIAAEKYARIEKSTYLYKTNNENTSFENIYCMTEKTYFVEIIGDYGDFFRVNYNGQTGFIKRNDVKEITNQPNTPYPYNIKILVGSNCNLRKSPTTQSSISNVICTLYTNEADITFIGRTFGEEAIDFGGTTWYYVKYKDNYGYIYSNYIKSITPIYENYEEVSYIEETNQLQNFNPITHTPSIILIVILFIPFIIILFILYFKPKSQQKSSLKKTPKSFERY